MTSFAVAAGHRSTAETAAEVLRAGGNAADAAIAGALVACVAEPVLASLMGGGFLMARKPGGETRLLDFFVQTPRVKARDVDLFEVEADFGEARQVFHIGAGSIATWGVPRGLTEAHARLGRMPFADLAAPAALLAKEGAPLSAFQARVLDIVAPIFTATPEARRVFGDGERPLKAGEIYRNPALADVIETFAIEGERFMQEGEPAQAALSLEGGHLSARDLTRYQAIWRSPLVEDRGALRLHLNPPPSLGGALIAFALRLIGREATPAEIARAFAATSRARIESALGESPYEGTAMLLSDDLLARYRKEIAGHRPSTRGTTHLSVIDGAGMAVSLTLSNGEGCGRIAPGTGLMPNNMLGEEDLVGPDLMGWTPDSRLSSMMAPMVAARGDGSTLALGSGGSNRIRTALAQVIARVSDGARLEDAIAEPRLHVEGGAKPHCDFEDRLRDDRRAALLEDFPEAHAWAEDGMFFGGVHGAARDAGGGFEAAADHRRDGHAIIGGKKSRARK